MPRVETNEAAAPASRVVEKTRLFIILISPLIVRVRTFSLPERAPSYGVGRRDT
jgi:hypothetical protein